MAMRAHARRSGRSSTRLAPRAATRAAGRRSKASATPPRSAIVWGALVAAMTTVGGVLLMVDGGRRSPLDGMSLPSATALMAVSAPRSVEAVLDTRHPLDEQRWQAIMVHHSGAAYGTAESIETQHRAMGLRGLGHHFVIGNGNGMGNGELFVGRRWLEQLPGAHAAGNHDRADWFNRHAISICLVGDGNRREFTEAQVARLMEVVSALAAELNIPADRILLHSDEADVADPGVRFPAAAFREMVAGLQ